MQILPTNADLVTTMASISSVLGALISIAALAVTVSENHFLRQRASWAQDAASHSILENQQTILEAVALQANARIVSNIFFPWKRILFAAFGFVFINIWGLQLAANTESPSESISILLFMLFGIALCSWTGLSFYANRVYFETAFIFDKLQAREDATDVLNAAKFGRGRLQLHTLILTLFIILLSLSLSLLSLPLLNTGAICIAVVGVSFHRWMTGLGKELEGNALHAFAEEVP